MYVWNRKLWIFFSFASLLILRTTEASFSGGLNSDHGEVHVPDVSASDDVDVSLIMAKIKSGDSAEALRLLESLRRSGNPDVLFELAQLYFYGSPGLTTNFTESLALYEEVAQKTGNASAHFMAGFIYSIGLGTKTRNIPRSLLHFRFAAMANHDLALMALGYRFRTGLSVNTSCEFAKAYYKSAAAKVIEWIQHDFPGGRPLPHGKIRLADESGGFYGSSSKGISENAAVSHDDIIQFYQYNAERGDTSSQWALGRYYYRGSSKTPRDVNKALYYLRKASSNLKHFVNSDITNEAGKQGAVEATALLGLMYWRGEGVQQNNATAFQLFSLSATHGSSLALNNLGLMHLHGIVVEKSINQAVEYFKKASEYDYPDALVNLGDLYLDVMNDLSLAVHQYMRAAHQNHIVALFRLASLNEKRLLTDSSCERTTNLYKIVSERGDFERPLLMEAYHSLRHSSHALPAILKYLIAAESGDEIGQANVAFLLEQHQNILYKDIGKGVECCLINWNRAANQGNVDARIRVGDYYYYGYFTKKNYERSAVHYQMAASEQSSLSMFNLGFMYENGLGLRQDFHLAKRFYDQALASNPDAYLPINLSLVILHFRHFVEWFYHGGSFFLDIHPEKPSTTFHTSENMGTSTFNFDSEMELQSLLENVNQDGEQGDEDSETLIIFALALTAILLLWARNQPLANFQLNPGNGIPIVPQNIEEDGVETQNEAREEDEIRDL